MNLIKNIQIALVKLADFHNESGKEQVTVRWLGQAGFEMFYGDKHLMIDPYLSDSLAKKYKGGEFPHLRMMPIPVEPRLVQGLDWLLCTHRHSDHLDPETVPAILKVNPQCRLIAPKAERVHIEQMGVDLERVILVNADDTIRLSDEITLEVLSSSHEDFKIDNNGNHHYLGFIIGFGDITIYHSGDCIPYVSLPAELSRRKVNIAMLPINGRDEYRRSRGVLGNFTFEEAVDLCRHAGISTMICHHFGMFDFNTIGPDELARKVQQVKDVNCFILETDRVFIVSSSQISIPRGCYE